MLASLLGCSVESLILDDDMLSSIRRIGRGIEVNDDTLSLEVIEKVVRGAGHFLGEEQTLALMKSEFSYPKYADRSSPEDWANAGSLGGWERARQVADELLGSHFPVYIAEAQDKLIRQKFDIFLDPVWMHRYD